jgi:hypothetical protein
VGDRETKLSVELERERKVFRSGELSVCDKNLAPALRLTSHGGGSRHNNNNREEGAGLVSPHWLKRAWAGLLGRCEERCWGGGGEQRAW